MKNSKAIDYQITKKQFDGIFLLVRMMKQRRTLISM